MAAAQQTLAAELQQLLAHLVDRLTPNESGRRRSLSPKAIEGLKDFVERFQQLGIHTSGELDSMVRSIQEIAQGVDVASLRQHPEQQAQLFTDVTAAKQAININNTINKCCSTKRKLTRCESPCCPCLFFCAFHNLRQYSQWRAAKVLMLW